MRIFGIFLLCSTLLIGCAFRRDIPDETKVQSFPAWQPAPDQTLPIPE